MRYENRRMSLHMRMPSVKHRLVSEDSLRSDGRTMVANYKKLKNKSNCDGYGWFAQLHWVMSRPRGEEHELENTRS